MNKITQIFNTLTGKTTKAALERLEAQISAQKDRLYILETAVIQNEKDRLEQEQETELELQRRRYEIEAEAGLRSKRDIELTQQIIGLTEFTGYNQNNEPGSTHLKARISRLESLCHQQDIEIDRNKQRIHDAEEAQAGFQTLNLRSQSAIIERLHDLEATTHVHSQDKQHAPQRAAMERSRAARKADLVKAEEQKADRIERMQEQESDDYHDSHFPDDEPPVGC